MIDIRNKNLTANLLNHVKNVSARNPNNLPILISNEQYNSLIEHEEFEIIDGYSYIDKICVVTDLAAPVRAYPQPYIPPPDIDLNEVKRAHALALNFNVRDHIYKFYDPAQQASLQALWTEAILLGYANRIAYIGQALVWVKSAIMSYYPLRDAVMSAEDRFAVYNVQFDPEILEPVPLIDVEIAISMND